MSNESFALFGYYYTSSRKEEQEYMTKVVCEWEEYTSRYKLIANWRNCKGIRTINRRGRRRQSLCRTISRLQKIAGLPKIAAAAVVVSGHTHIYIYRFRSELPKRPHLSHSRIRHDVSMLTAYYLLFVAVIFTNCSFRSKGHACMHGIERRQGEDRDSLRPG